MKVFSKKRQIIVLTFSIIAQGLLSIGSDFLSAEIEADRLSFDRSGDIALANGNVTIL